MKKLTAILGTAALIAALSAPAKSQVTVPGTAMVPLGYCQLTSIDTAVLLSTCPIPATANAVYLEAEAQAIRYRDDGTAPTASVGMPVAVGGSILYVGALANVRVISQTSGAKLNALFYRSP